MAVGVAIALMDIIGLFLIIRTFFPLEFALSALTTAFPWLLAGLVAYLGFTTGLLETKPLRKGFYLIIAAAFIWLCYLDGRYGTYVQVALPMLGMALLWIPALLLPVHRYRHGG